MIKQSTKTNRKTKLILICGTNGTGKTTFCTKNIVEPALEQGKKVLVVTSHETEWNQAKTISLHEKQKFEFTGLAKALPTKSNINFLLNYSNGTLILDDMRNFCKPNMQGIFEQLSISRRQKMMDIVVVGHGLTKIPPGFFAYYSELIMFRTLDNLKKRANDLLEIDKIMKVQKTVNSESLTNPHFFKIILA